MKKNNFLISISVFLFLIPMTVFCQKEISDTIKLNDSIVVIAKRKSLKYYVSGDYSKAVYFAKQEVVLRRNLSDKVKYKNSLFNLGLFFYRNKQFYKSIETYNIVIDSFDVDRKTYQSYCGIGRNYKRLEDYFKASEYFEKGLSNKKILGNKSLFIHSVNYAVVNDYIETKKSLKKELELLKESDSLSKIIKLSTNNFYNLNLTYANYYKNDLTFNYNKSKGYYLKVLERAKSVNDTNKRVSAFNNLSILLIKAKNDSANYYIEKGIGLSKKTNPTLPKLYYNQSKYYFNTNELDKALESLHKALQSAQFLASSEELENSYERVPKIENLSSSTNKFNCLIILRDKGNYLLEKYLKNNDEKYLKFSLENLFLADQMIDLIKQENIEKQAKLFWQNEASKVYINAIKTCQLLNKHEEAFYFIEKNKALLLLENISENQIKQRANIPIEVLEKELELKQKINRLENELNKSNSNKNSIKNQYYTTKIELGNFIKSLESSYPEYYNYKKPIDIIKLQNIQSKLDTKTMVLEYILDDADGYLLAITKNKTSLHKLDSVKNINEKISIYLALISQPIRTKEKQNKYNTISQELYSSLFPFSKKELTKNISKLVIIPDYTLQNIPFESLKNSNEYLINDYEISYAYSLSFLEKNKTTTDTSQGFIGFAPYNFNYDHLATLKNSKKELQNAVNHFSGVSLTDSLATKQRFLDNVEDYNIIHLATHATANDAGSSPWIAFKNKKLHLNELYTLKTSADLVVLSACKTSLGKINKGEGVFSLARGFFYSGSKSVVSSLWNVNDKSSQEILSDFYINLKDGKTKSEALRQAKLNYINTHQLSEQSPYYWSSFVLIGDTSAIPTDSFSEYYPYVFILFLIIIGYFLYRKKPK